MKKIKGKIIIIVILGCLLMFSGCIRKNTQPTTLNQQANNNAGATTMIEKITPTLMTEEECKSTSIEDIL